MGGVDVERLANAALSDLTVFMKYAKYLEDQGRRETWAETVERSVAMHVKRYPHLETDIRQHFQLVHERKVLPSMRALQFAGRAIEVNPARGYNCSYMPMDHVDAFGELMFLLLSGCGVGYSVQSRHVAQLPTIVGPNPRRSRRFLIADSIEGWADAVKVLVKAYMFGKPDPVFDFRDIRPKGARLITSGGKAPGPQPLKDCLHNVRKVLDSVAHGEQLTTLQVHDINCYIADAVLAGGIRRSAMIALFDVDDEDMLTCKFGNWYEQHEHRGRANNSAVIVRHKADKATFDSIWSRVQASGSGEPGFFFTNDPELGLNPCAEVSLRPNQFCNLTTINAVDIEDQADLERRAAAAAFIGTLQAGYTDFHYLRDVWRRTTEKEALIGVSMTGVAAGRVLDLDLTKAAEVVKAVNADVAARIGIRAAARCTTLKPEGTASNVVSYRKYCSSGIHDYHSEFMLRRMRVGKNEAIYQYLAMHHPELVEDEFFKPHLQAVISVPLRAPEGAMTRANGCALRLLERVKKVHAEWIRPGHRKGSNTNNVSATVTIKPHEWGEVGEWLWQNRDSYTALSVLPYDDHTYVQAPFEEISEAEYTRLVQHLTKLDLTQVRELDDHTAHVDQAACAGGACEVDFLTRAAS